MGETAAGPWTRARRAGAALLPLLLLACAGEPENGTPSPADGKAPRNPPAGAAPDGGSPMKTTWPVRFGSPRRDCASPARTAANGEVAWSRDLGIPAEGDGPELLVWEGRVLAAGGGRIALFSAAGDRLWQRDTRPSPVAVANGLAYHESRERYLEAVDPANALVLAKASLPGIGDDEFFLTLLWPRERDFVTASYVPDPKYDSEEEDAGPLRPLVFGHRTVYGNRTGAWGETYEGVQTLPPLFLPESSRWIASLDDGVVVVDVDVDEKNEVARFRLPVGTPVEWSADAAGVLCVEGLQEGRKTLVALTSDGKERWRWTEESSEDPWAPGQPPIRSGAARVWALTETRVLAFDDGTPAWAADAAPAGGRRRATALADGSLLVAGGPVLRRLDDRGRETLRVTLDQPILSSPVVDADGAIYVATATKLVKIR